MLAPAELHKQKREQISAERKKLLAAAAVRQAADGGTVRKQGVDVVSAERKLAAAAAAEARSSAEPNQPWPQPKVAAKASPAKTLRSSSSSAKES